MSGYRRAVVFFGFAFVGWAICAAIIGIGMSVTSLETALVVHAVGAPLVFAALSSFYFRKFGYTTPTTTALAFTGFVMAMDLFVVALAIQGSLQMFASVLGTWLPFALIFLSTLSTGTYSVRLHPHLKPISAGVRS